jgi:hypothetical protein
MVNAKKVAVVSSCMGLLLTLHTDVSAMKEPLSIAYTSNSYLQNFQNAVEVTNDTQQEILEVKSKEEGKQIVSNIRDELKEAKKVAKEEQEQKELEKELQAEKNGLGKEYTIPESLRSEFKSYMSYTAVTSVSSPQYKLLNSEKASTDSESGVRMYDGRYCIALGSHFTSKIGTKVDLVLANGTVLKCVLGDQKSDRDTDATHTYHEADGSVVEFIVDSGVFGNVKDSSGTVNFVKGWSGKVKKIIVLDD